MKTWEEFVTNGLNGVVNDMGETRNTTKNSIVFPNGWVASIVRSSKDNHNWSMAICDYNGYFDWNKLTPFGATRGCILCDTEEEVAKALAVVEAL